jgi:ribosome biogenesis GTPase / thiamine phosphate phosphatase
MLDNDSRSLESWGWDARWAASYPAADSAGRTPARVTGQDRDRWSVQTPTGPAQARIVRSTAVTTYPITGDWVVVEPGPSASDPLSIVNVLPRRSAMSRGAAGSVSSEQVLAANVDVVWIVHGLDLPPNPRRLERYLTAAWESGATPVVVLTKADLALNASDRVAEVEPVCIGVPVYLVSSTDPECLATLTQTLKPGRTYALVGPSGAGKSTLINALAAQHLAETGEVREVDRKGRHTTTRRELFKVTGGALLMDTPGLREFKVWSAEDGLAQTFPEIDELAASCRFRDCQHESEPGCAVLAALENGEIDRSRLASYRSLRLEAAYLARRDDPEAQAAAVAKHKTAMKTLKYHHKRQNG